MKSAFLEDNLDFPIALSNIPYASIFSHPTHDKFVIRHSLSVRG